MTPTDATRPADGLAPAAGHTETPGTRKGLRGLLGDRFDATLRKARQAREGMPRITAGEAVIRALAAVLPDLLAEAWDEGYRLDWTGGVKHVNPYRPEPVCSCPETDPGKRAALYTVRYLGLEPHAATCPRNGLPKYNVDPYRTEGTNS